MKLLGISLGTLVLAGMVWATLWFWGKGLTYKPYDHVLTSWTQTDGKPVLALSTSSYQEAKDFLQEHPDGILQINLKVSSDGKFFTALPGALDFISKLPETRPDEYKGNKHYYYKSILLRSSLDTNFMSTWIQLQPRFWIFNVEDNAPDVDKHMIKFIEENNLQDKVVIVSDVDLVISSMKEQRPLWVYGSSLSDLAKFLTLASVNLESLANFKRDYFFTPLTIKNRDVLNPKVITEVKKRFKKVAIGPVHTDQDRARALEQNPDILILGSKLTK